MKYRCKECTLPRCDSEGEVCDECAANMNIVPAGSTDNTIPISATGSQSVSYTFWVSGPGPLGYVSFGSTLYATVDTAVRWDEPWTYMDDELIAICGGIQDDP
jgi:hypothetical protein